MQKYLAMPPKPNRPAWERLAERLRPGNDVSIGGGEERNGEEVAASAYLERIRTARGGGFTSIHDGVKEMQEELQEEIAMALGRTALSADAAYALLASSSVRVEAAAEATRRAAKGDRDAAMRAETEARAAFTAARSEAIRRRTELLIHRQAVGFKTKNHDMIAKFYPVPPPLPPPSWEVDGDESNTKRSGTDERGRLWEKRMEALVRRQA